MGRGHNNRAPRRDSLLGAVFVVPAFTVEEEDGEIYDVEVGDWGIEASGERPC